MFTATKRLFVVVATVLLTTLHSAVADVAWKVEKTSGEVWVTREGAQPVALNMEPALRPGDNIRTGRNGRVLLTRGEERIVISPNSEMGLAVENKGDLATTIKQQAGSILLSVEKKNTKHFEVETPYLAAVVKGTQFQVSVNKAQAQVNVLEGQVQVSDFKSGQQIVLLPGQAAAALANGAGGLSLSGSGKFNAIEQGAPRASGLRALFVPKGGLRAPASVRNGNTGAIQNASNGVVRIGAALGEVKLDYNKVTKGLVRASSDAVSAPAQRRNARDDAGDLRTKGNELSNAGVRNAASNSDSSPAAGLANGNSNANGGSNGLALGVGNKSGGGNGLALGVGNSGGNGLALGVGNGNGGGTSLAVGVGTGGGGDIGVGLGVGNGNGGNGLTVSVGNGGGIGIGLGGLRLKTR
jgi:hypothetical protein